MAASLRKMNRDYLDNALNGTWAKTGRGVYTRSTGEVVEKVNGGWVFDSKQWGTLNAAMWWVDGLYRRGERGHELRVFNGE